MFIHTHKDTLYVYIILTHILCHCVIEWVAQINLKCKNATLELKSNPMLTISLVAMGHKIENISLVLLCSLCLFCQHKLPVVTFEFLS